MNKHLFLSTPEGGWLTISQRRAVLGPATRLDTLKTILATTLSNSDYSKREEVQRIGLEAQRVSDYSSSENNLLQAAYFYYLDKKELVAPLLSDISESELLPDKQWLLINLHIANNDYDVLSSIIQNKPAVLTSWLGLDESIIQRAYDSAGETISKNISVFIFNASGVSGHANSYRNRLVEKGF